MQPDVTDRILGETKKIAEECEKNAEKVRKYVKHEISRLRDCVFENCLVFDLSSQPLELSQLSSKKGYMYSC